MLPASAGTCTVATHNPFSAHTHHFSAHFLGHIKPMRWARAHKFMIYEVTDPVLRSQLCYYRN